MTTLEIIKDLCAKEGISLSALEKEMNYGNGSLSKATKIPSDRILELSKRFEKSMEYLMTGEERNDSLYANLDGIYLSYAKEAQENGIDPEDIRLALDTIKRLRGGN